MARRFRRMKALRHVEKTTDEVLNDLAQLMGTACPTCGHHTNPKGCCNKECALYSGVPF